MALSLTLLAACGSEAKSPSQGADQTGADAVAEVGVDLKPGVYTSPANSCIGFAATTREFNLDDEEPIGEYSGSSVLVRDQDRIVLVEGDFFHTVSCEPGAWKRESGDGEKSIDPATTSGACTLLINDRLLDDALTYARSDEDDTRRSELQDRLMSIVSAGTFTDAGESPLSAPVGQLVDFLDDPKEYVEGGQLVPLVSNEVDKITKICD